MKENSINFLNPSVWLLVFMAFVLGLRHGFDLDHLATIDAITRAVKSSSRLSKWVGILFSLGHGCVVILFSLVIASGLIQASTPPWLDAVGHWTSIFFLLVFGVLALWNSVPHTHAVPIHFRGILLRRWFGTQYSPLYIMLIGALFAISFDTFTQVALLSMSASMMAGIFSAIVLGVVFMLGMMASDGFNGWCVSWLIQCADKQSVYLSRCLSVLIASFSLILGVIGIRNQWM